MFNKLFSDLRTFGRKANNSIKTFGKKAIPDIAFRLGQGIKNSLPQVGTYLGALGGSAIGTLIGPEGTAIGSLVGSAIGNQIGGLIQNNV